MELYFDDIGDNESHISLGYGQWLYLVRFLEYFAILMKRYFKEMGIILGYWLNISV